MKHFDTYEEMMEWLYKSFYTFEVEKKDGMYWIFDENGEIVDNVVLGD